MLPDDLSPEDSWESDPRELDAPPQDELWDDAPDWAADDLEQAYQKALEAVEAVESELGFHVDEPADGAADAPTLLSFPQNDEQPAHTADAERRSGDDSQQSSPSSGFEVEAFPFAGEGAAAGSPADDGSSPSADLGERFRRISPGQVIEAALFVGGKPLTVRQFCTVLGGDFKREQVEEILNQLNLRYAAECRPYEIVFGEGGYRLSLRSEYESVSSRVFGLGPKEVKLSQDVLEVLALVAYQQPITREQIEELKPGSGTAVRQLLRRELIAIERDGGPKGNIRYRTTSRFLELFGLRDLEELPQADEFAFR